MVGKGTFELTKASTSASDGTISLSGADLLAFTLTGGDFFVGIGGALTQPDSDRSHDSIDTSNAIGLHVSGDLKLATIRNGLLGNHYLGLELSNVSGSLVGIPASVLSLSVTGVSVQVNQATTALGLDAPRLDWHALHAADANVPDFSARMAATTALAASGTASLDVLGLVTGSAHFELVTGVADVNVSGGTGAKLLTLGLTNLDLRVGTSAFGVVITGGSVALASLAPTAGDLTRRWVAFQGSGLGATLALPGVTASIANLTVEVNRATNAPALDWTTALDLDRNGSFGDQLLVDGVAVTQTAERLKVAGDLVDLDIFGLLSGAAGFEVSRDLVDVDLDGVTSTVEVDNAVLLTFGLTLDEAAPGDPETRFLRVGTAGFGLEIHDGTVRVAALAPAAAADARRWLAVQASGLSATLTLPFVNASVANVKLDVNRAGGLASVLDWTTAVDTDESGAFTATPVTVLGAPITLTDDRLAVSGDITSLDIAGFVTGSAHFELTKSTIGVDMPAPIADLLGASLLTLGLTNLNLTIGDPTGVHLAVTGGSLVLAAINPGRADRARRPTRAAGSR